VAGDLVRALRELHFQRGRGPIRRSAARVIETTGLADPAPLLATLVEMPVVAARYSLAGVVTVSTPSMAAHPRAQREAVKQVAVADRVVLSKCDLRRRATSRRSRRACARLNPAAPCCARAPASRSRALLDTGLHRGAGARRRRGLAQLRRLSPHRRRAIATIPRSGRSSGAPRNRGRGMTSNHRSATLLELRGERVLR
jgi:G3E family GTPase